MHLGRTRSVVIFSAIALACSVAHAQNRDSFSLFSKSGSTGQGTITVTATIVPSVGIVFSSDGEQQLIVANAPGNNDFTSLRAALTQTPDRKSPSALATVKAWHSGNQAFVEKAYRTCADAALHRSQSSDWE